MKSKEIEKQLSLAHKTICEASVPINLMLSTRRLSIKVIEEAAAKVALASDHMQRLVTSLKED